MKTKFNWGIIGPGWIAEKFAAALAVLDNANLFAVASRSLDNAKSFAARYQVERAYGSYEELAKDPDVDVIYIATPHPYHFENTMMCLEHGKAILCEKPFAMNEAQVQIMMAKAREKNVFLMEAMWSRFLPLILKTKELIDAGEIGEVKILQSDFGFNVPFNPEGRQFNKQLGGGTILDIGIYPLFMSLYILGEPQEINALALMGKTDVDESCAMTLKYESGALASLHSSFQTNTPIETTIFGTKGNIKLNRMWFFPTSITVTYDDGRVEEHAQEFLANGYEYEAIEVMECLNQGKKESGIMTFDFSLKLIRLLDQVRKKIGLKYEADE